MYFLWNLYLKGILSNNQGEDNSSIFFGVSGKLPENVAGHQDVVANKCKLFREKSNCWYFE